MVGETYADHYWGDTYRVTAAHANGEVSVMSLDGIDKGRVRTHRTHLHPDGRPNLAQDDHPISQACGYRWECRKRSEDVRTEPLKPHGDWTL